MNDLRQRLSRSRSVPGSQRGNRQGRPDQGRPCERRGREQEEVNSQRVVAGESSVHRREVAGDNLGQVDDRRPWNDSIQRLEEKIGDLIKSRDPLQRGYSEGSPFVARIVGFPTPAKFKPSTVTPKYDGSTNPVHHIEMYQSATDIYSILDEMKCRAFFGTLKGAAHIWFTSLPKNSIENFKVLAERFIHNFCFGVRPQSRNCE